MFANEGSDRLPDPRRHRGAPHLSHHQGDDDKQAKIAKINRYHMEQFAYFLGRLNSIREGDGTLLDNSMIVYGSGIGDGNAHNHDNLPILLAGGGGGANFKLGRHVRYEQGTPLMNLYLAMLGAAGVDVDAVGDSTGVLEGLGAA